MCLCPPVQERLTKQIALGIWNSLQPLGVAVVIEASWVHACVLVNQTCLDVVLTLFTVGADCICLTVLCLQPHVYGDARRPEDEQPHSDQYHAGGLPGRPQDQGGIPDALTEGLKDAAWPRAHSSHVHTHKHEHKQLIQSLTLNIRTQSSHSVQIWVRVQ